MTSGNSRAPFVVSNCAILLMIGSAAHHWALLEVACQLVALHVTEESEAGGVRAMVSHREPDLAAVAKSVSRSRRGGRRQIPDADLGKVAEVYQANPNAPTKAVGQAFGVAPRTASLYVKRARDAGLLPELER